MPSCLDKWGLSIELTSVTFIDLEYLRKDQMVIGRKKTCLGYDDDIMNYRRISNISRTKSKNLLFLLLSLPNPSKPGVKLRMMM